MIGNQQKYENCKERFRRSNKAFIDGFNLEAKCLLNMRSWRIEKNLF